jgi:GTP cyclohydrolase I
MTDVVPADHDRIEAAVRELLAAIGEDPSRDGLLATPGRVARMHAEVTAGMREDPAMHLETTFEADHDEIVIVRTSPSRRCASTISCRSSVAPISATSPDRPGG